MEIHYNRDAITEFSKTIVNSDLWQIGLVGITEKQIDKLNMEANTANILKGTIRFGVGTAIALEAWACSKGYVAPEIQSETTPNSSEIVPTTVPVEQISTEKLTNYGQFLIGEAGIGKIISLDKQANPNQDVINKIEKSAYEYIPETKDKDLGVNIYDMKGENGTVPFIIVSTKDKNGNVEFAYVGFSIDENNVQRPPVDGNIQVFYPLRVVTLEDESKLVGIPDLSTKNLQTPAIFFIDKNGNSYFYPPYTDYVADENSPFGGMKVQAILSNIETPVPTIQTKTLELKNGDTYELPNFDNGKDLVTYIIYNNILWKNGNDYDRVNFWNQYFFKNFNPTAQQQEIYDVVNNIPNVSVFSFRNITLPKQADVTEKVDFFGILLTPVGNESIAQYFSEDGELHILYSSKSVGQLTTELNNIDVYQIKNSVK